MPSSKYIKGETVRPNPKTEKMQVVFDKDHEEYFNITLSPMIWFLHDNVNGWEISNDGRLTIHSFLMNFADECRNDHFHKDNIDEFNTVSRIRNNALLIMYSLLGGYKLTGDYQEDIETLGITDDSFDRMYKKIQNLPKGMSKFIIYFPDRQPIRAYRHFVQEPSVYDENGSVVLSQIKLVEVDIFAADEYDKAMEGVYSDREFTLSCENIPARVSYINGGNEEIFISW